MRIAHIITRMILGGAQENTLGVDRHDPVPKFDRSFFDDKPAADAGVVYQHV